MKTLLLNSLILCNITAVIFFSNIQDTFGQTYHLIKEVSTAEYIAPSDNINKIYFRVFRDTAYLVRAVNGKNGGYDYRIALFNLGTGKTLYCDTIRNVPGSFRVTDVQVRNRKMIIMSNYKFIFVDLGKTKSLPYLYPTGLKYQNDDKNFDKCEFINDTLLLLYTIYDYHPFDGKPGVYLTTFDLKSLQLKKNKVLEFPGVSVSGVTNNWLTIVKSKIYIITPLSSLMYSLNFNLENLDTFQTNIFTRSEHDSSIAYEHYSDSVVANASAQVMRIMNKYPADSQLYHMSEFLHPVYSKDFLLKVLKDIQSLAFVRQIFTIDDSLIAICISKPNEQEVAKDYRDVIFYDPIRKKITKKYRHLSNSFPVDNLKRPEDFFIIEFWDKLHRPYIHNGYAYYYSLFSLSSFHAGKYDDLSLKLLNEAKKKGYKWTLKKYKLD